ncbi:glutathione-dependent disulfide-bond oxidoreductase [Teredinibacter turnerae]|uniref:glutathione-dependent disulfide-bond oxidoreductase n=1 Tax=Teredinibacter turnerae TaxID=2426 RepID=UPI0005F896F2|nr:glutathione-dependent disulfide-bond oxidoreductase [Teredinibacter turnerae]
MTINIATTIVDLTMRRLPLTLRSIRQHQIKLIYGKNLMSDSYTPPTVWTWQDQNTPQASARTGNQPVAGARFEQELPRGEHPLQLYSMATPNGVKVTVMLEELLAKGHRAAEYDAWLIDIMSGDQFSSGFVEINPNSKIPALVDHSTDTPLALFESGSILIYLAEKFGEFLPTGQPARAQTLNWLAWQVGSAPYLGGGFGHFYAYAPSKQEYPIDRFAMETKRQLDVLDKQLAKTEFIAGDNYSIADMAIAPWYGALQAGELYNAGEFLRVEEYANVERWRKAVFARPAYQRGARVNRFWGPEENQLKERHSAADLD